MHKISTTTFMLLCVAILGISIGCSDNKDSTYPSVVLEFLTVQTSSTGEMKTALLDSGEKYDILQDESEFKSSPDTTLRMVAYYDKEFADGKKGVHIYGATQAVSPIPKPLDKFEDDIFTDPVNLISLWQGFYYINLIVEVKMQAKKHRFHFIERQNTIDLQTKTRSVDLQIYHDSQNDLPAYSSRGYLSIPMEQYLQNDVQKVLITLNMTNYNGENLQRQIAYIQ